MNGRLQSLGTLNPPPPHARSDGRASRPRCGIGISGEGIGYGGVADQVVKSAGRTLEIFEYLANRAGPAGIADIAGALGYPRSSTSVLVASLLKLGYLVQDARTRKFQPSLKLTFLGAWLEATVRLQARLEALARQTGETVVVAQQVGIDVQYIQVLPAPDEQRQHVGIGTRRRMVRAATGWVLLAGLPDRDVELLLRRSNAVSPPEHRVDRDELMAKVDAIRRSGHASGRCLHVPTHSCVVSPAPGIPGQPPLAVGVAGPSERVEPHKFCILDAFKTTGFASVAAV